MQNTPRRGLRNIKTLSGIAGRTNTLNGVLLKLLCLEMEKVHRMKEKISFETRGQGIDKRLKYIDHESKKLLQLVNNRDGENNLHTQGLPREYASQSSIKGLTLRY